MDKKRTSFEIEGYGVINSIEEMAKITGKDVKKVVLQVSSGATDEEIFRFKNIKSFEAYGVTYNTLLECLLKHNIDMSIAGVRFKLGRGATLEEIIEEQKYGTKPDYMIADKREKEVEVNGVKYPSLKKAHDELSEQGLVVNKYSSARVYVCKGMSATEALLGKQG